MTNEMYEKMYNEAPYVAELGEVNMFFQATLAKVLTKLPESVSKFALERCVFTSMPMGAAGVTREAILPERAMVDPHKFYLIIVDEVLSRLHEHRGRISRGERARRSIQRLEHVFAHEIAHACMKKDAYLALPEDVEAEADRLVAEWGFVAPKEL